MFSILFLSKTRESKKMNIKNNNLKDKIYINLHLRKMFKLNVSRTHKKIRKISSKIIKITATHE